MSRRDLVLIASTAAISSLLTYLACANLTAPPEVVGHESGAAYGTQAAASNYSARETVRVKAGGSGFGSANALQQDSSARDDCNHSASSTAHDPARAFRKQQELREQFSGFLGDGSSRDSSGINAKIESRFYLEEWNQEWARSRETNIRTLFDANEELGGVAPLQVTCRSKNCQVVLPASSQNQVRVLSQKFMQAATNSDLGMQDQVVSFFPDIATGRLVFYVSENGNMDLFQ